MHFQCVRKILNGDCQLCHFCPQMWNNLAATGQIFMKFGVRGFVENLSWEFKFY